MGGTVRFATAERVSGKTLTRTRHLYQGSGALLYRVTITGEHLRGSGSVAPVALATWIGLQPGSSLTLISPLGPQLLSWAGLQPAFGTIQRFLAGRNILAGQEVFLTVGADLSFDVSPVQPYDASRAAPGRTRELASALLLTGCDTYVRMPDPALAHALGLPQDSSRTDIIDCCRDRGDTEVADLLLALRCST